MPSLPPDAASSVNAMSTSRPFTADHSKLAYAQVFSRTSAGHQHAGVQRHPSLRGLAARLHRSGKPTR